MYISILYNIINCHARVFYEKSRTNLDLLSIPRLWGGKTNTEYTGSLGYNSVLRVCDITSIDVEVILDTCSTIVVVVVVFTLKTVLTSIQYPSLSYSSRQRNEFPWSHANPK